MEEKVQDWRNPRRNWTFPRKRDNICVLRVFNKAFHLDCPESGFETPFYAKWRNGGLLNQRIKVYPEMPWRWYIV